MSRSSRPKTGYFSAEQLLAQWSKQLNLRDPGFAWDGSRMTSPMRGKSLDLDIIVAHRDGLRGLLALAPSGFPSHADLRAGLLEAHDKFGIFVCGQQNVQHVANQAAENWRMLCRTVYKMKKRGVTKSKVQDLIDMIEVNEKQSKMSDSTASTLHLDDVQAMFPEYSGEEAPQEMAVHPPPKKETRGRTLHEHDLLMHNSIS